MWTAHRYQRGASTRTAAKQGKADASSAAVPPPPPTVAPKPAPERRPKVKSAYRRKKQSTEDRKQQQEDAQQAQAELRAGHEVYLSPDALAARAAAVQANQGTSQAAWRHVVQPVIDLVPALLQHHSNSSSKSALGAASTPTLLVVDGYNLLHQHPSTKALLGQRMDLAQLQLHQLLRAYCHQQPSTHVLMVYDAHSVAGRSPGFQNLQLLGDRVSTLYTAGKEADTVIIDLVSKVLDREVKAQAQLGPNTPTLCNLFVHTNDNRIRQAVTDAVFSADGRTQRHALRVTLGSSTQLSEMLQLVENKLQGQQQHQPQQQWSGPGLPDPQHNTVAWAKALLARSSSPSSSSSSSWDSDDDGDGSSGGKRRRRRRQTTQQLEAERLAASLGDEQLLQLAAAGGMAGAGAAAVLEGVGDAADTSQAPHPAAAEAAAAAGGHSMLGGNVAAAVAAAAASSSAASRELDELLSMDLDSFLPDELL